MTRVVHCRKEKCDVYIGRPSIWGNPFVIGKDGSREEVLRKHNELLLGSEELQERVIQELKGRVLGCWCKPLPCHGDNYVRFLEGEEEKDRLKNLSMWEE